MAALCESSTLCALRPDSDTDTDSGSGIQGVEAAGDQDRVIVTDRARCVTLYTVSDHKPLGSWAVKQGQSLTCPAVYNSHTKEYVVVSDHKVIRVWKDEDIHLDKAFKATVTADVWRVHASREAEPVVLFQRGGVRPLDSLLSAPQQNIEEVLGPDEAIRWSTIIVAEARHFVIFTTEQRGEHFLYAQTLVPPGGRQRYRLEREGAGLAPLSFSARYRDAHLSLLYLYPNGHVYQSVVGPLRRGVAPGGEEQQEEQQEQQEQQEGSSVAALPRSRLLRLPVGGAGLLGPASALALDDAHVAVVGGPHPSAGPGKDFLCVWNTDFHTLQVAQELPGTIYGQLWICSGRLLVPHGRVLSVVPYECHRSSLASALGKLRQASTAEPRASACVPPWTRLLPGDHAHTSSTADANGNKVGPESQSESGLAVNRVLELIKAGLVEEVQREVEGLLRRSDAQEVQAWAGPLAAGLVGRSLSDPAFYPPRALAQLLHTHGLCYSACPGLLLLALERRDYFLCQLCLQLFPDVPENVTVACLEAFLSVPDGEAEMVSLEPDSVSFMETLVAGGRGQGSFQNGFSPAPFEEDSSDAPGGGGAGGGGGASKAECEEQERRRPGGEACPVGLHKAVLLNEVLQTAYSDTFLLPHLKHLSADQVMLFLRYLQFLYLRYSQDASSQAPGLRSPTLTQVMDWVCLLLDAHFTVLVMAPEAKGLLLNLHKFVKSQVRLFSELGKVEGSLQELHKMKVKKDVGQYSIQVIQLF